MHWIRRGLPYHPVADLGVTVWLIVVFWGSLEGFLVAVGLSFAISLALGLAYRRVDCEMRVKLRDPMTGQPTHQWVRQSALARRVPRVDHADSGA